jgi:23S rRNA (uridine2552-2'-O)-methyltransferase
LVFYRHDKKSDSGYDRISLLRRKNRSFRNDKAFLFFGATMTDEKKKKALGGIASRRREAVRVKAKKNRTESSRKWLLRQLNDPYVAAAKEEGYRSRAAYKMLQLDEQFKLLRPGQRIVDLGAAPGGWSQVAVKIIGKKGKLIGIDLLSIAPMEGAEFIQMDFLDADAPDKLKEMLQGDADLVLSDMAHSTVGHAKTDHIRVMALAETAAYFAMEVLTPGGAFVCKFFQGGAEKSLLDQLKKHFTKVKFAKPAASRKESSENYLVALGFRK